MTNNGYEVKNGDTLWHICKKEFNLTSNQDIANKVAEISKKNNIDSNSIFVGQKIDLGKNDTTKTEQPKEPIAPKRIPFRNFNAFSYNLADLDLFGIDFSNNNAYLMDTYTASNNYKKESYSATATKGPAVETYAQAEKTNSTSKSNSQTGNSEAKKTAIAPNGMETKIYSRKEIEDFIKTEATKYGIEPTLISAIILAESSFKPFNKNKRTGAAGLMQLMPKTARFLGCNNPYDAKENIKAGIKHFARLFKMYNYNVTDTLCAYNCGEGNYNKFLRGERKLPKETQDYAPKIMKNYKDLGGTQLA